MRRRNSVCRNGKSRFPFVRASFRMRDNVYQLFSGKRHIRRFQQAFRNAMYYSGQRNVKTSVVRENSQIDNNAVFPAYLKNLILLPKGCISVFPNRFATFLLSDNRFLSMCFPNFSEILTKSFCESLKNTVFGAVTSSAIVMKKILRKIPLKMLNNIKNSFQTSV